MYHTKHKADHRPITEDEIETATRALGMRRRDSAHLKETLDCHQGLNAFASAVIVAAVQAELERRGK